MPDAAVDTLRRGYEALNRGDLSSFERFLRGWIDSFEGFAIPDADAALEG